MLRAHEPKHHHFIKLREAFLAKPKILQKIFFKINLYKIEF